MKATDNIAHRDQDQRSVSSSIRSADSPAQADSDQANGPSSQNLQGISTACFVCRTRHLKCDRGFPCSRCTTSGSECTYVASRRGVNRPRTGDANLATDAYNAASGTAPGMTTVALTWGGQESQPTNIRQGGGISLPNPQVSERCVHSFYTHFHSAHPFVLPEQFLSSIATQGSLEPLVAAMRWLGSLYLSIPHATRSSLLDNAYRQIYDGSPPRDVFLLQAMMVLLVGLDGMCEFEQARKVLGDASDLVAELSAHRKSFAEVHGQGIPVLEESLRRTWWDLYVIDAMIAGVHRASRFALFDLHTDVPLPCEEWQYLSGDIPPPRSLDDLEIHGLDGDEPALSSFAYRILCARNLGRLLRLPPSLGPGDEDMARLEASLTNWRLHLPPSKRDAVGPDVSSDEMMFQAHMMLHATTILLHYPHAQIDSLTARNVDACSPGQSAARSLGAVVRHSPTTGTPRSCYNAHTRHAVAAAREIGKLITHRTPLRYHTPFFTCVVVLASVVQLNRWGSQGRPDTGLHEGDDGGDDESFLRDQVRLGIGALAHMAEVWQSAATALGQVRGVARELHVSKQQQRERWRGEAAEVAPAALTLEDIFGDDPLVADMQAVDAMMDS